MLDTDSIGAGLAILGTAEVSKDAIQRLLAPTADYVGAGILQGSKAIVNTVRVLANAVVRLGTRIEQPGAVPPRVLREIVEQAPFCDDELTAEYLGGIMASSYSDINADDRGVALLATLRRLSTYAIRTHYICYRDYWRLHEGKLSLTPVFGDSELHNARVAEDTRVVASRSGYCTAMGLSNDRQYDDIYFHASRALAREDLLHFGAMGDRQYLSQLLTDQEGRRYRIPVDGFVYDTQAAGDELFLWALGQRDLGAWVDMLLVRGVALDIDIPHIPAAHGFQRLAELATDKG